MNIVGLLAELVMNERRELLHAWQRHYNMIPRSDSKLTELYVNQQLTMSVDEVARELMATEFIYKNTLYGEVIEEFMRIVADRLKNEYNLPWKETWQLVSFYAPIALKLMCLSSSGKFVPEHLPHPQDISETVPETVPKAAPNDAGYIRHVPC